MEAREDVNIEIAEIIDLVLLESVPVVDGFEVVGGQILISQVDGDVAAVLAVGDVPAVAPVVVEVSVDHQGHIFDLRVWYTE